MRLFLYPRALACLAALTLVACSEENPTPPAPPPPEVAITTLKAQPVPNIIELPGRVQAVKVAEIRARVTGIIQERTYEEGTEVEAGQLLFVIDPREMKAALDAAVAALQRAQATAANAEQVVERYRGLVDRGAISEQEFDTAQANLRTARADAAQAKAQVQAAKLDLEHTSVESPIDGLAGLANVTVGALVSATEATLLTRVEQFQRVHVVFSQSSSDLLALRAKAASGALDLPSRNEVEVRLTLEDGSEYPHVGYLDFMAMTIDQSTGTVTLRAEFPNPDRVLLPNQFVRARVHAGTRAGGLTVPQRAVMVNDSGATVMVVGEDGKAQVRTVDLGEMVGSRWIIDEGLQAGDRVIVEGWQNLRDGMPVRTVPVGRAEEDADSKAESLSPDKAPSNDAGAPPPTEAAGEDAQTAPAEGAR
ncbi:efflux RND transporter periplasmic adaptor subunit [Stutzerimonas urumqiensis]|uniref:efflux RND transporter periplasmic adaptor subunit n=1 Tax=Stutzerimonas urumqiensis TaxID=638269 RepID=UPI003BA9AB40